MEGYETLVFRGASRTLAEVRPELIFFEVCPDLTRAAGFDVAEPAQMLVDMGYDLKRLESDTDLMPASPEDTSKVLGFENWIGVPIA